MTFRSGKKVTQTVTVRSVISQVTVRSMPSVGRIVHHATIPPLDVCSPNLSGSAIARQSRPIAVGRSSLAVPCTERNRFPVQQAPAAVTAYMFVFASTAGGFRGPWSIHIRSRFLELMLDLHSGRAS